MTDSVIDTSTPEALMRTFTDRVHARDLDGLVALYETAAVFEPRSGVVVEGRDAIGQALAELLALGPTMAAETVEVLQADNVALVQPGQPWSDVRIAATARHGGGVQLDVAPERR
jgi:ketosteroid isomerase-like protein